MILFSFQDIKGQIFNSIENTPLTASNLKSFGTAWVDINNDGFLDLFVANIDGDNELFINNKNGAFQVADYQILGDLAQKNGASFTTSWADINNDGNIDAFIGNFGSPSAVVLQNENHHFKKAIISDLENNPSNTQGSGWGDYDNDGDLDLFIANTAGKVNQLFDNQGNGKLLISRKHVFENQVSNSHGVSWGDFNDDGYPDLFVAENYEGENLFYLNKEGEFYQAKTKDSSLVSIGASWVDYDNDGDLDLFVTNSLDEINILLRNNGNGELILQKETKLSILKSNSMSACWGDYDNDGDQDVFISNSNNQPNNFFLNDGLGNFTESYEPPFNSDKTASRGCSNGDYDNDGDLDLFITNGFGNNDQNLLYQNTGNTNHWLKVRLRDNNSVTPIGTKVYLKTVIEGKEIIQMRELSSQTGAYGHNAQIIHFGIGDSNQISEIKIVWPDGTNQIFNDAKADTFYELQKNQSLFILKPKK